MHLTITESASHQIKEMIKAEENSNIYLRVGVKGGGCSGLSYGMGFEEEVGEKDLQMEQHGIQMVIDEDDAKILDGVVIDFKQNMMGGGFTIDNPNAIATCGCGSSFKTKDNAGTPEDC